MLVIEVVTLAMLMHVVAATPLLVSLLVAALMHVLVLRLALVVVVALGCAQRAQLLRRLQPVTQELHLLA